jgi:hypothetical protein
VKWKTKLSIFAMVALCIVLMLIVSGSNTRTAPRASGELVVPDHLRPIISRACRDCHTDQTQWPWYSRLPLVSLLIEHDVKKGREHLNFSTWAANQSHPPTRNQLQEVCDAVSDNEMPPRSYRILHPDSRLSSQDIDAFCDWADMANNVSPRDNGVH